MFESWTEHLAPFPFSRPIDALELNVGAESACWMMDNLLVLEDDRYFGVGEVSSETRATLGKYGEKVRLLRTDRPANWMYWPHFWPRAYGFIHLAPKDQEQCATLIGVAWLLLKPGGVLIVDGCYPRRGPQMATVVDVFLEKVQWKLLWRKVQLAITKA